MNYTIELTNKQKAQMDCIMEIVHRYVGFNPKLEPIKAVNVEDTDEYQIGYKQGISDSKAQIKQAYNNGYNIGSHDAAKFEQEEYNKGLEDVNHAMEVLTHMTGTECAEWFEGRMGVYKVVCDYSIQRIVEIIKDYEEKEKAEEIKVGEIKVGDEVIGFSGAKAIVTVVDDCDDDITLMFEDGSFDTYPCKNFRKTGRHFDEVEQLFGKLRGVK